MVETLSNLKNNKIKKAAGQTAGNEAVERMKKFLSGLSKKRHGSCFRLLDSACALTMNPQSCHMSPYECRWTT